MKVWLTAALAAVFGVACLLGAWPVFAIVVIVGILAVWLAPSPPTVSLDDPSLPGKRMWLNDKYTSSKVPSQLDTIIIGSGMSGLTAGALLARFGRRVVVLEQHDIAGGGTHTFDLKGYRFDSGLHYTVPWHSHLFKLTGLRADVPECEFLGEGDGTFDKIILNTGELFRIKHKEEHLKDLYKMFPEETVGLDAFVRITDDGLISVQVFCFSKLFPLWLQPYFWMIVPKRFHPCNKTMKQVLDEHIKSKKLQTFLSSLWLDSGGRPDEATLMLTGGAQRGLPKEGGCYPRGGAEGMARFLVGIILQYGGRVLVEAPVKRIITSADLSVTGVEMADGSIITAKEVVSSAGYRNTYESLLDEKARKASGVPKSFPVKQSPGFIMCNIGIKGTPQELQLSNTNVWFLPVNESGDMYKPLDDYFRDPMAGDIPCMITWPSIKEQSNRNDNRISCQMLAIADNEWFAPFRDQKFKARSPEYEQLKKQWEEKFHAVLFKVFPQVKERVEFSDVSTPLTIKHYMLVPDGAAVGLDQTPLRYSWEIQKHLDMSTPIHGLWMTGQDTLICGVVLAQLAGVITACRMLGPLDTFKIFLQPAIHL